MQFAGVLLVASYAGGVHEARLTRSRVRDAKHILIISFRVGKHQELFRSHRTRIFSFSGGFAVTCEEGRAASLTGEIAGDRARKVTLIHN